MDIEKIKKLLNNSETEVHYYKTLDSTNNTAKEFIGRPLNCSIVIIAETQTAGRGRFEHAFHSPPNTGIYMSVALKNILTSERDRSSLLTPAAAVGVCRAVMKLTDKKPQIKWVNDVLLDGKKFCGILTESVRVRSEEAVGNAAIIGIGINYSTDFSDFPELNAVSLFGKNPSCSREELTACVINELEALCADLLSCLKEYRELSCLINKKISYMYNKEKRLGTVFGIDDAGRLLVESSSKIIALSAGEVELVKKV